MQELKNFPCSAYLIKKTLSIIANEHNNFDVLSKNTHKFTFTQIIDEDDEVKSIYLEFKLDVKTKILNRLNYERWMVRTNKFLVLISIIDESIMTLGFMHHQLTDVNNELTGLHVSDLNHF